MSNNNDSGGDILVTLFVCALILALISTIVDILFTGLFSF